MSGNSTHFSFKHGGVSQALKHACYIVGHGKYAGREDVIHVASGNMPRWADDSLIFWNAADLYERSNGRTYHEFEFAIPRELSPEEAREFANAWITREIGCRHPYLYAVHNKLAEDGLPNIHCHAMFSDRLIDGIERSPEYFFRRPASRYRDRKTGELREPDPANGGVGKDRRWNNRRIVSELRRKFQIFGNKFLAERGHHPRLDLRSNAERGFDAPEPKIGPEKRRDRDRWRDQKREQVKAIRRQHHQHREMLEKINRLKRELKMARRERAQHSVSGCREDVGTRGDCTPWYRSPLQGLHSDVGAGRTVYRWTHGSAAGLVALIDRGGQVNLAGKPTPPKVQALIELAKAKGWQSLVLTGSAEFKRLAAAHALRHGLKVANPELADFVSQHHQEIKNAGKQKQQHRAFTKWDNRGPHCAGLRTSQQVGPKRMPTLRNTRACDEQQQTGNSVLQRAVPRHRDRDRRLHSVSTSTGRAALARKWLMTASKIDALTASDLKDDLPKLLEIFENDPSARAWEKQRSEEISIKATEKLAALGPTQALDCE